MLNWKIHALIPMILHTLYTLICWCIQHTYSRLKARNTLNRPLDGHTIQTIHSRINCRVVKLPKCVFIKLKNSENPCMCGESIQTPHKHTRTTDLLEVTALNTSSAYFTTTLNDFMSAEDTWIFCLLFSLFTNVDWWMPFFLNHRHRVHCHALYVDTQRSSQGEWTKY